MKHHLLGISPVTVALVLATAANGANPSGATPVTCAGTDSTVLADSARGFSGTQGACGWSYGYLPNGGRGAFTPMKVWTGTNWQYSAALDWRNGNTYAHHYATGGHPHGSNPLQWIDRRWTSAFAGSIWLTGKLKKDNTTCGDGVVGRIKVGGTEIWKATVNAKDGTGVTFDLKATVAVGTPVDFILDPRRYDQNCDASTFAAIISRCPTGQMFVNGQCSAAAAPAPTTSAPPARPSSSASASPPPPPPPCPPDKPVRNPDQTCSPWPKFKFQMNNSNLDTTAIDSFACVLSLETEAKQLLPGATITYKNGELGVKEDRKSVV